MPYLYVAIAICCNVAAQFLLKISVGKNASIRLFSLNLNGFLVGGLCCYIISFYFSILIYKTFSVSFIGPLMMAIIVLLIAATDKFLFSNAFDTAKITGLILIASGATALTFSNAK